MSSSASSFLREIGRLLCSFPELTTPMEMGEMVINQTFLPSSSTSHFLKIKIDNANKVEFMF